MKMNYPTDIRNLLFTNASVKQTIFKNTFWLSASTVFNKLLSLALIVYAARILGAEGYGQLTFALAFASLLMVFSDLGLSAIITREFAKEEKKEEWNSLVSLKLVLALGTFLLVAGTSFLIAPARDIQAIIMVLALFLLINSLIGAAYAFFHARQRMEYEAWFETLQTLLIVAFGLFALFRFPSPGSLSLAYLLAGLCALVVVFVFFQLKIFPLHLRWNVAVWKKFLQMSWPLALIGLFGMVYSYTDSIMLGYWGMLKETGWYNAAYKIVTASLVPMGLIGASFYPALSKFSKGSKEKLQRAWNYELEIMIALALPLVTGGIALAFPLMSAFYPASFAPSVAAFQILIGTAGLIFLYRPLYDALIVLDQQKKTFWVTTAGAVGNVALNLILIPQYSLYGAAAATVATHSLVLLAMAVFIKRFTFLQFPALRLALTFGLSAGASAAMYGAVKHPFVAHLPVFLVIPLGAVAYFLVFFFFRQYVFVRYIQHAYAR